MSNKLKHEQGVWEISIWKYPGSAIDSKVIIQTPKHAIAEALESYYPKEKPEFARHQAVANACLIAAAPELLSMCERALKTAVLFSNDPAGGSIIKELERVIAKARS